MKKKLILIGAILAIAGLGRAQMVKKDAFEKAVDFVNCKIVEQSLEYSPSHGVLRPFTDKCKCQANPNFDAIKSAISSTEIPTLKLSNEIESLKQGPAKQLQPEKVITYLIDFTEKVFQGDPNFSSKKNHLNKLESLKKSLKSDLSNILISQTESDKRLTDKIQGNDTTFLKNIVLNEIKKNNKDIENKFDALTFRINIFLIFIAVVLVLLFIWLLKRSSLKLSSNSDNTSSPFDKNWVMTKIGEAQSSMRGLNQDTTILAISNIEARIKKLDAELKELKLKINSSELTLEIFPPKYEEQSWQETKPSEIKTPIGTFFLSTPNSDGSFNESSASSSYKEGASIYRFTKIDHNKAEFQIDEKPASIKLALQYPDIRVEPCCNTMNTYNSRTKRIVTTKKGISELSGDKWELKAKAEIRYES